MVILPLKKGRIKFRLKIKFESGYGKLCFMYGGSPTETVTMSKYPQAFLVTVIVRLGMKKTVL